MATKICNARAAAMTNIGIIVRLLLPFFLNRLVTVAGMSDNLFDEEEELPSLFPFRTEDYVGFTVAVLGLILAAGGGIGGGGILVPTYILLLDFPVKHAIPLASVTVFGGAVANNMLNARETHPEHPHRPIVDWDLILQLEPMTILGAMVGTTIYDFIPDVLLVILMIILLTVTAYKTLAKANKMHEEETRKKLANTKSHPTTSPIQMDDHDGESNYESMKQSNEGEQCLELETQNSFDEQHRAQAIKDAIKLTSLFVAVTLLDLLRGAPSEGTFWATDFGIVASITAFAIHTRWAVLYRYRLDGPRLSDIEWDERNTITYPLYAVIAGLAAGMFGVGGGIVKGPLMLALGVHPAVASASSACMILYTSSISTLSYMTFGSLVYDYGAFCLLLGFLATLLGQTLMKGLLRHCKRHSLIAYSIGGVVMLSAFAMGIDGTIALLDNHG